MAPNDIPHKWIISATASGVDVPIAVADSEQDAMLWVHEVDPSLRIYRPRPDDPDYFVFRTRGSDWEARYIGRRVPVISYAENAEKTE